MESEIRREVPDREVGSREGVGKGDGEDLDELRLVLEDEEGGLTEMGNAAGALACGCQGVGTLGVVDLSEAHSLRRMAGRGGSRLVGAANSGNALGWPACEGRTLGR
jgi:hypothetical protein